MIKGAYSFSKHYYYNQDYPGEQVPEM